MQTEINNIKLTPGPQGATGPAGPPGTSVTVTTEPPGPNCANGGVKLTSASGINYVCNGSSSTGLQCTTAANCPVGNQCKQATCTAGVCGFDNAPVGIACFENGGTQCNGAGSCVSGLQCTTAANCPVGNQCKQATCTAGVCGFDNAPIGISCFENGGTQCNGAGSCVSGLQCTTAANCPAGNQCQQATCTAGVCGFANAPVGIACAENGGTQCNGAGSCVSASCPAGQTSCSNVCKNLSSDTSNCGACGSVCNSPNGASACTAGVCTIAACNPGFADCDQASANGCETNTAIDVNSCGACGRVCSTPNGTPACTGGLCHTAICNPGFADCNGVVADGCETNTANNVNSCGVCGHVCASGQTCSAGVCH